MAASSWRVLRQLRPADDGCTTFGVPHRRLSTMRVLRARANTTLRVRRQGADADRPLESSCRASSRDAGRSEEHTSELQSPCKLVCRLLLEKRKRVRIIVV